MQPIYENPAENFEIFDIKVKHRPPHVHKSLEFLYIISGSLELGVGLDFYHMEKGDYAIIFPEIIHHYQIFDVCGCNAIYLLAAPILSGEFFPIIQQKCPDNPVIKKSDLHPDVIYAMKSLLYDQLNVEDHVIYHAFIQIILARCFPYYNFIDKKSIDSDDIVYKTVSYIANNFTQPITLKQMSHYIGCSPYTLSRVFSSVFHTNFNQYLNNLRLDYACSLLEHTTQSITEICGNSGFDSLRTFNRVFKNRFHITPRDYREVYRNKNS